MEEIKKSIVDSLDGIELELLPYFPYILQDLWEFGADPATMLELVKKNLGGKKLKILDLGCGKGAVSIKLAVELNCLVKGIDAMPAFIEAAKNYALKFGVNDKCDFEVGDIRIKINDLKGFDIIILGAIGPVLGDLQTTLSRVSHSLTRPGYVLLDDGYIADDSKTGYSRALRKTEFYQQLDRAGYEIVQEDISNKEFIDENDDYIYNAIKRRIDELIAKHPDKKELFEGYLKIQQYENEMLSNEITTGTWLLKINH